MKQENLKAFLRKYRFLVTLGASLVAILIAVAIGSLMMLVIGKDPLAAYAAFVKGIFGNTHTIGETANAFVPLMCCAMSFAIARSSGYMNLGCQGQMIAGTICATVVGTSLTGLPAPLHIALCILAGMLGGLLVGAIPGILKIAFGATELIATLLLNYIMTEVLGLLLAGPLKNPKSMLEQSALIEKTARLPVILDKSRMNIGIIIVLVVTLLIWFLQNRTVPGFEMRLAGTNSQSARYAGVNITKNMIMVILISGALSGLGGALELQGNQYKLMEGITKTYGFDAVGVAVLGQYNPFGMILSSLLFAMLRVGAGGMERNAGVPEPLFHILQGVIIVCIIVSNYFVSRYLDSTKEGRA